MLEKERKALFERDKDYISIGISEGGVHYGINPVMWEGTASAFNMRTQDIFIAPEGFHFAQIGLSWVAYLIAGITTMALLVGFCVWIKLQNNLPSNSRQAV